MINERLTINKRYKYEIAITIMLSILLPSIVIYSQDDQSAKNKMAQERYKDLLISEKMPQGSIKIKLESTISDEILKDKEIFFQQVMYICLNHDNNIYASDMRQHRIYIFNFKGSLIRAIGRKGQGPGEFNLPKEVFCDNAGNIFVNDMGNGRIDIFNETGEYQRSFKRYKTYKNMNIDKNGLIYANYISSKLDEENIIEVLNNKGELIRSFGKRVSFKGNSNVHNEILLTIAEDKYIYALWKFFNILRKYSLDGKLLVDTKIKNNTIEDISENNNKRMIPVSGSVMGRELFSGVYYYGGKIYLLKSYPRLEIYECDDNGNITKTYWSDIPYDYIGSNLLITNQQGGIKYITLQEYPENRIAIYSNVSK